jgi:hypothetical protein
MERASEVKDDVERKAIQADDYNDSLRRRSEM